MHAYIHIAYTAYTVYTTYIQTAYRQSLSDRHPWYTTPITTYTSIKPVSCYQTVSFPWPTTRFKPSQLFSFTACVYDSNRQQCKHITIQTLSSLSTKRTEPELKTLPLLFFVCQTRMLCISNTLNELNESYTCVRTMLASCLRGVQRGRIRSLR